MKRVTKKDTAYHQIKQMFLERHFEPDSMLSENEIAAVLGMSRTPVREAIQILQSEGFVNVFPKRGIMFRGISVDAAREILDLRAAVECYVTSACIPLPEANLTELQQMLETQRRCCEIGDVSAYLKHDVLFHSYFVDLYNNSLITGVVRSINERFMSVGLAILRDIPAIRTSCRGHRAILEAVKAGSVPEVIRAVHAHIDFGKAQLCLGPGLKTQTLPQSDRKGYHDSLALLRE